MQAATTAAQRQLFINSFIHLSEVIGTQVLPARNDFMDTIQPMISAVTKWTEAHPELTKWLFRAATALLFLKAASLALRLGYSLLLRPILHLICRGGLLLKVLGGQSLLIARLGGMFS